MSVSRRTDHHVFERLITKCQTLDAIPTAVAVLMAHARRRAPQKAVPA